MDAAMTIGTRREVFWDDALLESRTAALRLAEPVKKEVVLTLDRPWEGRACNYFHVFKDGGRYRMYYRATDGKTIYDPAQPLNAVTCLAESADGVHWERANVGLVPHSGQTDTNILPVQAGDGFFVFKDPNPACPPKARYKAICCGKDESLFRPRPDWPDAPPFRTLWGFTSPDGLSWEDMPQNPLLRDGGFDSMNTVTWDAASGEYRLYFRNVHRDDARVSGLVRDIWVATSKDFVTWENLRPLQYGAAPDEELYTNNIQPYYRAPHVQVGFPTRYVERPWGPLFEQLPNLANRELKSGILERYGTVLTDALFMTSRDGVNFDRWGEAFLTPGPFRHNNWVYGDCYLAWGLVETPADDPLAPPEISLYAPEDYTNRAVRLRRYTVRLDGFACLHAGGGEETVLTKPLVFSGERLTLNMATSVAGYVKTEVLNPDGTPIEGFSGGSACAMFGDAIELNALFKRGGEATCGLSPLAGRPVRLRFTLRDARLYAMQFV